MITFKIDSADVILNDLGDGHGKIIISDTEWGYNFSYYWGAMGNRSLAEFLCSINSDYFINKLGPIDKGEINTKKTITNIRKGIKEYFNSEYPWYTEMDFQKDMRDKLKDLEKEGFYGVDNYFYAINNFVDSLDYYNIGNKYERNRIEETIKLIFNEPWYYLAYNEHRENIYLQKFHKKLVKELTKNKLNVKTIETI